MQKMQKLTPKIEAIKQKYRGKQRDAKGRPNLESQRKMNEEMQELFKAEGVNPAGGCLPLLLQMPVFFAFFALLRNSVELWNAPWIAVDPRPVGGRSLLRAADRHAASRSSCSSA